MPTSSMKQLYRYMPADSGIYVHMDYDRCPDEFAVKIREIAGSKEFFDRLDEIFFTPMANDNFFAVISGNFPKISERMIFSEKNGFTLVNNTTDIYKQSNLFFKFAKNGVILVTTALNTFIIDNSDFSSGRIDFFENWIDLYGASIFASGGVLSKMSNGALNFSLENIFIGIRSSKDKKFICDFSINFANEKTAKLYLPIIRVFLANIVSGVGEEKTSFTVEFDASKLTIKNIAISQHLILP